MIKILEKVKKEFNSYNPSLKKEFKKTFPVYFGGVIANGINMILHFILPYILGQILDMLLEGNFETDDIFKKIYEYIAVVIALLIVRMIYRTLFFTVARASDTRLRKKVIHYLQYVKPEYYEKENKGTFLEYVTKEILSIREFLGNFFFEMGKLILNPTIILVLIAIKYHWSVSLVLLIFLLIMVRYIFSLYEKLKIKVEEGRKADIEIFKTVEKNTSGFSLIKLYNEQENQIKKFNIVNEKRKNADYEIGVVKNRIANGNNIIRCISLVIAFGMGLILVKNNIITLGELTSLITTVSFMKQEVVTSIPKIINAVVYFKQSTRRYNYLLSIDKYKTEGKELKEVEKIVINNLTYSYDGNTNALNDINIEIKNGEKIGIIGQVGSGKTTLMNIISGFLEVPDNSVLINGVSVNEYSKDTIFKNISYSTQKNIIVDDTIENNINISKEKDADVEKVSKLSDIYQDVMEMEDKFKTKIGERGNRLSGGQKQRVQIARNLLKVREINIYDDTLSALDQETEKKVLDAIIEETNGNILIVVSNKISSMEKLDKVYMLIDGRIYDKGTHQDLLKNNQLYREMYTFEKEGDIVC